MQLISERIAQEARILLKSTNWTINESPGGLASRNPTIFQLFQECGRYDAPAV